MREQEPHSRRYSRVLLILVFLFCLRVIGQMLVAFLHVSFLPPMKEWFSGLLPYPELVVSQSLIILLFSKVYLDFHRGAGYFVKLSPRFSRNLMIFGCVYFSGMIVRYVLRMSLYPDQRWFGGTIPIIFHCVLASFILVMARFNRRNVSLANAN
jgi:uncharacterized protein